MAIKAIIMDIEGTTSSISFVHDVLFPYARHQLPQFVRENQHNPDVARQIQNVCKDVGRSLNIEQVIEQLIQWIDEDQKITSLKLLQGMVWQQGYVDGCFTGHVYSDVPQSLHRWNGRGIELYVYSSGSVAAQRLIFGYSDFGDLTPLFTGYFDTEIGAKREATAYENILKKIQFDAGEVLFLSDTTEELDAASRVGIRTIQLVRDSDVDAASKHKQVNSFAEVLND